MDLYIVLHNQGFNGTPHHGVIEMSAEDAAKHLGDEGTGFLMEADPSSRAFTADHAHALKQYREDVAAKKLADEVAAKAASAQAKEAKKSDVAEAKETADKAEAERKKSVAEILSSSTLKVPPAESFGPATSTAPATPPPAIPTRNDG